MLFRTLSYSKKHSSKIISLNKSYFSTRTGMANLEMSTGLEELKWTQLLGKEDKAQLDPRMTLIMGQCFNWNKLKMAEEVDIWVAIVEGKALAIKSEGDCTYYADLMDPGMDHDNYLRQYFQLDHNLEELYKLWGQGCPRMKTVTTALPGVRVLRQDPWECLISFICSSNNNIS